MSEVYERTKTMLAGIRVLLVEDHMDTRVVFTAGLRAYGAEVHGAENGAVALAWLEESGGACDVVVTDMVMPVMGGAELAAQVLARWPDLPCIGVTGVALRETGRKADFRAVLRKPLKLDLLVGEVLGQARPGVEQ